MLVTVTAAALCGEIAPSYSYRYRITLTVKDHGQLRKASNVVEITENPPGKWQGCFGFSCLARTKVCGEATALQLSNGNYLLALMNGTGPQPGKPVWLQGPTLVLLHRLGLPTDWWSKPSGIIHLADSWKPVVLEDQNMPELVVVRDKDNPLSLSRAARPSYDPAWLGEGIIFDSITLQPTKEAVTKGKIYRILPWLSSYDDQSPTRKWDGKKRMGFKVKQFARYDRT
jgi:hypothetical protein